MIYYVNLAADDGETALVRAAKRGREKIVELLIQYNANIDPVENHLMAPLSAAAANSMLIDLEKTDCTYILSQFSQIMYTLQN